MIVRPCGRTWGGTSCEKANNRVSRKWGWYKGLHYIVVRLSSKALQEKHVYMLKPRIMPPLNGVPIYFASFPGFPPSSRRDRLLLRCSTPATIYRPWPGLSNSVRYAHINAPHKLLFVGLSTKCWNIGFYFCERSILRHPAGGTVGGNKLPLWSIRLPSHYTPFNIQLPIFNITALCRPQPRTQESRSPQARRMGEAEQLAAWYGNQNPIPKIPNPSRTRAKIPCIGIPARCPKILNQKSKIKIQPSPDISFLER